jgi:hypothetical protein
LRRFGLSTWVICDEGASREHSVPPSVHPRDFVKTDNDVVATSDLFATS